jgi:hypothetical protein
LGEPHASYDGPFLLDLELGEGATLRVLQNSPIRSTRSRSGAEDVEKLGAGSRPESVEAFLKSALELVRSHGRGLRSRQSRVVNTGQPSASISASNAKSGGGSSE